MLWNVLIAAGISLLILSILWIVRGIISMPIPKGENTTLTMQIKVSGHEPSLEQTVDGLLWLINNETVRADLEIVDVGMDLETQTMAYNLSKNAKVDFIRKDHNGQSPSTH